VREIVMIRVDKVAAEARLGRMPPPHVTTADNRRITEVLLTEINNAEINAPHGVTFLVMCRLLAVREETMEPERWMTGGHAAPKAGRARLLGEVKGADLHRPTNLPKEVETNHRARVSASERMLWRMEL
jgi:hypothetical protein